MEQCVSDDKVLLKYGRRWFGACGEMMRTWVRGDEEMNQATRRRREEEEERGRRKKRKKERRKKKEKKKKEEK